MAAATPLPLSKKSHEAFIAYYNTLQNNQNKVRGIRRSRYAKIDREYQREVDLTEENTLAKSANASGDTTRFRNITVPVIMPQVEAAVVYQSSVFLTGQPLFGVVSSPEYIAEAKKLEALIDEAAIKGGWARELMMFFRDGFKYNFAPLEVSWTREVTSVVTTDVTKSTTSGVPKEVLWEGNSVRRLDPYNTFVDPRVPASEVYKKGEFAGYTELMSRIMLKQYIAELPDVIVTNVRDALESGTTGSYNNSEGYNYYTPDINPEVSTTEYQGSGTDWMAWCGLNKLEGANSIAYKDVYEVTTLYTRVLPSEFLLRIPKANTPRIYKLIIINHQHIIYAEAQTNAHNYLPILVGQPAEDGLSYQTKSLATNGSDFQNLTTSYMTSIIASRRRAVTDRVLYDPSRITAAHINSANPSAKIPVRPAAYGKNISEAVYQFPYREDQQGASMQQIQTILGLADQLVGQNRASQGQFVKGNKTLQEFESVMSNANGRDQMAAILLEHQVFTPMKQILKLDLLQYQGGTTIYDRSQRQVVEVDPVQLRKAVMEFKVSDGLVPASKLLNSETFAVAMQVIGSSPQISSSYNISQLFSYIMKTQGADIEAFEKFPEQVAYEQAVSQWQGIMQLAIEKGIDPATLNAGPMPEPTQFGYNPQKVKPAPEAANQPSEQAQLTGVLP